MKTIAIILAVCVTCMSLADLKGQDSSRLVIAQAIKKQIRPFDISYFNDSTKVHYAIICRLDSGAIVPIDALRCIGNMPYQPKDGEVKVQFLNSEMSIVDEYAISDPFTFVACDGDEDSRGPHSAPSGSEFILKLKPDRSIETIRLSGIRGISRRIDLDVRKVVGQIER